MAYIYKITNNINGKIYIGQTINSIQDRWKGHCSDAKLGRNNSAIDKAIKKYGPENFSIDCIDTVQDDERFEKETEYIKKYNSMITEGKGYNMVLEGFDLHGYEVKPPKEIIQYSLNGELIHIYSSKKECVKSNPECNIRTLNRVLNKEFASYKGYLWKYIDDEIAVEELIDRYNKIHNNKKMCKQRKIAQLDKDTEEILSTYESLRKAAEAIANNKSCLISLKNNIGYAARNNTVSHGYKWKYLEELEYHEDISVIQLDKDTKQIVNIYPNALEASKALNLSDGSGICKAIKKRCIAYGYYWEYQQ